jgi:hypothetical protein
MPCRDRRRPSRHGQRTPPFPHLTGTSWARFLPFRRRRKGRRSQRGDGVSAGKGGVAGPIGPRTPPFPANGRVGEPWRERHPGDHGCLRPAAAIAGGVRCRGLQRRSARVELHQRARHRLGALRTRRARVRCGHRRWGASSRSRGLTPLATRTLHTCATTVSASATASLTCRAR